MSADRFGGDRFGMASSLPPPGSRMGRSDDPRDLLPKLVQETELQKLLTDEKMRAEQHRTNYQTLKAEHARLQEEYLMLQTELRSTIEESRLVQEKYKSLLEQLRKDIADKNKECEELKAQTMNPQKLELLRLELADEAEKPFREKYQRLEEEVERYRGEYNKLKYDFSFLKAEYDHDKAESQRVIEEMRMRHEAEVSNLRQERESLISRQQTENSSDSQRVRVLQRENAQIHLKMKGLTTELEEIRAQREHSGLQSDNVSRLQNKQLAEHMANVKALETERESLKLQVASLQKEVHTSQELQTQLTSRIHDLEKDNIQLKSRAEETTHKSKVDITNIKMEMLRERGELERERDRLKNEIDDIQSQVDILKHTLGKQEESLVDKEREAVRRVQAAREEEWHKLQIIENEKVELETKLQEIERRKIDEESQRHAEREKTEDRVRQAEDARQDTEKQLLVAKTKLQHQQSLIESLERERSENSDLKNRLHRIESAYNSYVGSERELVDNNAHLKRQVSDLASDLQRTKEQLRSCKDDTDKVMAQNRATWAEEKAGFQRRIDELDSQSADLHNQLTASVTEHRKKKKKFSNLVTKLKQKLALYQAKVEQLNIEKEALKKSVPSETHYAIKKQLKDLMRRHHDYRGLLLSAGMNEVTIGNLSFASAAPLDSTPHNFSIEVEKQYQKDLDMLKERLDLLDDNQKQQLQELKGISPISSPRSHRDDLLESPCSEPERDTVTGEV